VDWFRTELYRPSVIGGQSVRSVRKQLEVDCDNWRYRKPMVQGYAGANLLQPVAGVPTSDSWTPPLAPSDDAGRSLRLASEHAPPISVAGSSAC